MAKVNGPPIDVIGFQVVGTNGKPVSRRYAVRAAAEQFCELMKREGARVYVKSVIGFAEPYTKPKGKR